MDTNRVPIVSRYSTDATLLGGSDRKTTRNGVLPSKAGAKDRSTPKESRCLNIDRYLAIWNTPTVVFSSIHHGYYMLALRVIDYPDFISSQFRLLVQIQLSLSNLQLIMPQDSGMYQNKSPGVGKFRFSLTYHPLVYRITTKHFPCICYQDSYSGNMHHLILLFFFLKGCLHA